MSRLCELKTDTAFTSSLEARCHFAQETLSLPPAMHPCSPILPYAVHVFLTSSVRPV